MSDSVRGCTAVRRWISIGLASVARGVAELERSLSCETQKSLYSVIPPIPNFIHFRPHPSSVSTHGHRPNTRPKIRALWSVAYERLAFAYPTHPGASTKFSTKSKMQNAPLLWKYLHRRPQSVNHSVIRSTRTKGALCMELLYACIQFYLRREPGKALNFSTNRKNRRLQPTCLNGNDRQNDSQIYRAYVPFDCMIMFISPFGKLPQYRVLDERRKALRAFSSPRVKFQPASTYLDAFNPVVLRQ
ncbi:hypothetical protein DFP72DRAFT_859009 [Ephemerocybe angulata]|uniref:Uncharacterized protein n=1 Tax=Ephemerocybe angulata TaxID=980116 RepID=A0A8H6HA86_9AGAR|nr:hypothetical protein DFP72DRAFT_859009 [Tulosesus angulatus]